MQQAIFGGGSTYPSQSGSPLVSRESNGDSVGARGSRSININLIKLIKTRDTRDWGKGLGGVAECLP